MISIEKPKFSIKKLTIEMIRKEYVDNLVINIFGDNYMENPIYIKNVEILNKIKELNANYIDENKALLEVDAYYFQKIIDKRFFYIKRKSMGAFNRYDVNKRNTNYGEDIKIKAGDTDAFLKDVVNQNFSVLFFHIELSKSLNSSSYVVSKNELKRKAAYLAKYNNPELLVETAHKYFFEYENCKKESEIQRKIQDMQSNHIAALADSMNLTKRLICSAEILDVFKNSLKYNYSSLIIENWRELNEIEKNKSLENIDIFEFLDKYWPLILNKENYKDIVEFISDTNIIREQETATIILANLGFIGKVINPKNKIITNNKFRDLFFEKICEKDKDLFIRYLNDSDFSEHLTFKKLMLDKIGVVSENSNKKENRFSVFDLVKDFNAEHIIFHREQNLSKFFKSMTTAFNNYSIEIMFENSNVEINFDSSTTKISLDSIKSILSNELNNYVTLNEEYKPEKNVNKEEVIDKMMVENVREVIIRDMLKDTKENEQIKRRAKL